MFTNLFLNLWYSVHDLFFGEPEYYQKMEFLLSNQQCDDSVALIKRAHAAKREVRFDFDSDAFTLANPGWLSK